MTMISPLSLNAGERPLSIADLPDPTIPSTTRSLSTTTPNKGLRLQSILHSGQRKSAVINGHIKTIGSYVNGGRITAIKHDAVVISHNDRQYTLRLPTSARVKQRDHNNDN